MGGGGVAAELNTASLANLGSSPKVPRFRDQSEAGAVVDSGAVHRPKWAGLIKIIGIEREGMCGVLFLRGSEEAARERLAYLSHRGPDRRTIYVGPCGEVCLGHTLLSIVGTCSPVHQPYTATTHGDREGGSDYTVALCVNGEIYNSAALASQLGIPPTPCDCEVLLPYFLEYGLEALCRQVRGVFSLMAVEWEGEKLRSVNLARDPLGVKPLFYSTDGNGVEMLMAASSTVRSLPGVVAQEISPGTIVRFPNGMVKNAEELRYYQPSWETQLPRSLSASPTGKVTTLAQDIVVYPDGVVPKLQVALRTAVRRRVLGLDGDKVGILLSGGVDSAIVAALAREAITASGRDIVLHTFTASYQGVPSEVAVPGLDQADAYFARCMAAHVCSEHHEVLFTIEDAIEALPDVIYHLETFDIITVRAALPLFLLCRKVAELDIRVVLCGEGADELFAGYSLFEEFDLASLASLDHEIVRRLALISGSELLRVDRMTMAHGVEARVPFLDVDVVHVAMDLIPAREKLQDLMTMGRIEKFVLRRSFHGVVPHAILYRKKVQFADGVGSNWIEDLVAAVAVPTTTLGGPAPSEAAAYRKIFEEALGATGAATVVSRRNDIRRERRLPGTNEREVWEARTWQTVSTDPQLGRLLSDVEVADALYMLLGMRNIPPLCLELVDSIVGAMLQVVPFQNVTILTREKRPPTPAEVKDDVLMRIGGGCATVNSFLGALLSRLGFDICLLPASILQLDCHVTLLLQWEGLLYYVDVGNAYPYTSAARLGDATPRTAGDRTWRLRADDGGQFFVVEHLSVSVPDKWHTGVTFDPRKTVHFSFFIPMILRSRTEITFGPFLRSFRLARFDADFRIVAVRDQRLLADGSETAATSANDVVAFLINHYPDNLPLVEEAKKALELLMCAGHLTFPV